MFTKNDIIILEQKGISIQKANFQLEQFKKGVKPIRLNRPATIGDGILRIENMQQYIDIYENYKLKITKFVPASGAASRMFKSLYEFLNEKNRDKSLPKEIEEFFSHIDKFAFFNELNKSLETSGGLIKLLADRKFDIIIDSLLNSTGLSYGNLPKGLLKFHSYGHSANRTPFEEHLVEGALYARNFNGTANVHFTVSPEHLALFNALKNQCIGSFNSLFDIKFLVDFSVQKPSTDTIAVTPDNLPFYDTDNSLLFRPGGHGALIENLNDIDSDIIFIKNIDNVIKQEKIETTVKYKKMLAGKLIETQQTVFSLIEQLNRRNDADTINKAINFIGNDLNCKLVLENNRSSNQELVNEILIKLNRPIRVCGVVKNTGEPGGGPFLVSDENNLISPQIVESSQIDTGDKSQIEILNSSTHFNPVDIVCAVKDYRGRKFDLNKFVDENTCFISKKSKNGRDLKALELPGLWNGAMAFWNTIFIEVPVDTFNPVKTVNDLLRENHL